MKAKRIVFIIAVLAMSSITRAQVGHGGQPHFVHSQAKVLAPDVAMPALDNTELIERDRKELTDKMVTRVGDVQYQEIDILKTAARHQEGETTRYILSVTAPGATFLSLHFSKFQLPEGARMYIYNEGGDFVLGAYEASDALSEEDFYTQAIPGSVAYIEYEAPTNDSISKLVINSITHGYADIFSSMKEQYAMEEEAAKGPHGTAEGDCHINVVCPDGDNWRDQIRSVVCLQMTDAQYSYICSGALINNTNRDKTPYILTAEHCESSLYYPPVRQWVIYFLYHTNTCAGLSGVSNKSMTGATVLSRLSADNGSDFMLLRLNDNVPDEFQPYYAGWDRSTTISSTGALCIHHPKGDYKKLSFASSVTSGGSFWIVNWYTGVNNKGATEGGSSGSPLFNSSKRIVGQLYGGASSCTQANGADYYGRLYTSWNGGGTDASRLSVWLDPQGTNVTTLDGINYDYQKESIDEVSLTASSKLTLYPNPSTGMFRFNIDEVGEANYKVFDNNGRCVYEGRTVLTSQVQGINLSSLNSGTYSLILYTSTAQYSTTVVITK